jgi:xylulokinase
MDATEVIAAVDVGTSAVKAALVDRDGNVLSRSSARYNTYSAAGGIVEQQPDEWWQATCRALWSCRTPETRIVALAMSGQMQNVILVGSQVPLRAAILYSDYRAIDQAQAMLSVVPPEEWTAVTGNLQDASSLPAKLLWLKENENEVYLSARSLLMGAHHFVVWKATGQAVADLTTASTTGLLDLRSNTWAYALMQRLNLRTDWLPALQPSDHPVAMLRKEAASLMGLPEGIPVFLGAGDAATTTLGVGAGEPGSGYIYLGTSGWLGLTAPGIWGDPAKGIYTLRHPNPEWTILAAPMLTAAGNLDWARSQLFRSLTYAQMEEAAASVPPGCDGLIYLPYLAGERAPFRDPHARGALVGLALPTGPGHVIRAIMEGVAMAFRSIQEAACLALQQGPFLLTGGGSRSALWCQIFADVLGREVMRTEEAEDVALRGAALLAGRGLGWYQGYVPTGAVEGKSFRPDPAAEAAYRELYPIFCQLYPSLRESFWQLARFGRSEG